MLVKKNVLILLAVLFLFVTYSANTHAKSANFNLPQFTQLNLESWINSQPLQVNDLKGKVVLIDVWTFGCWNCYRSIPWLNSLEERFDKSEFIIVGIHTPEFEHEKERDKVVAKCQQFNVTHPVMMDNDFAYWKALGNQYWPTFYVADKQGVVQGVFIGETHQGDRRAKHVENLISKLIKQ